MHSTKNKKREFECVIDIKHTEEQQTTVSILSVFCEYKTVRENPNVIVLLFRVSVKAKTLQHVTQII